MTADGLVRALATRHADAVFVAECKNGPTQTGSHRRLDAWVLLKTWSPVTTIGYEIKVDRKDWRRDEKIADYMGLCHLLYLVAPKAVVPIEELPDGVGLLEPVGDGSRLVTRRKAARREIDMPVSLMIYVLMCRVTVQRESGAPQADRWRLQALREWAEGKDDRGRLHYALSAKIRKVFDDQQDDLERTQRRIRELEHIERRIRELGFDPHVPVMEWQVGQRLAAIAATIDPWLLTTMQQTEQRLAEVRGALEQLRAPGSGLRVDPVDGLL